MIIRRSPNNLTSFSIVYCVLRIVFFLAVSCELSAISCFALEDKKDKEAKEEPIIVNGDRVEYSMDSKEFTAIGNAEVTYEGTKLTCERLKVNTETKDAQAEGNARLDEEQGVVEGKTMLYNFISKKGVIFDSDFRANPYFGKARKVNKISEEEFVALRNYITTCNYDKPHYRIRSSKTDFFYGDKVRTRDSIFYVGRIPLAYLSQYNHSLRDPLMHVQLMPGKSKDWGVFLLSAWRYNLTEYISGRIYLDYRERLGPAEGFGANYTLSQFGKGDFKYYYTQERSRTFEEGLPAEFQRYFIRWRHQYQIDKNTDLTAEYFKIVDSKRILYGSEHNVLKDYFPLEYAKESLPLSYILVHRTLNYSTIDFLLQKRVNRWYSQQEKLPEIKYTLPHIQIAESPFYFQHNSSYVNMNTKSAAPSDSWSDGASNQASASGSLSLPTKMAFISLTPSIGSGQSYSDKGGYGSTLSVSFSTGLAASTKFYRLFDVNLNFLGLDINQLRHIITPSASYSYEKTSVMPSSKERFGGGATTGGGSPISLDLSNKLQTKRKGQSVDLADLNVTTTYTIKPKSETKRGSSLSDFLFDLQLLPYSWMRINVDATYKHTDKYAENYRQFTHINYDINVDFGKERTIGFGQRRQRKGGNAFTYSFNWRFNPKWRFSFYQMLERGRAAGLKRGLREQEYALSRDLHCWTVDFTYNLKRGGGETVWFVFRLKAFPELEFEYSQMYHAPKPGSQSNP